MPQGRRQMKKIHDACVHTVLGTSEQGGAALQAAVTALDDDWKAFEQQCGAYAGGPNRNGGRGLIVNFAVRGCVVAPLTFIP